MVRVNCSSEAQPEGDMVKTSAIGPKWTWLLSEVCSATADSTGSFAPSRQGLGGDSTYRQMRWRGECVFDQIPIIRPSALRTRIPTAQNTAWAGSGHSFVDTVLSSWSKRNPKQSYTQILPQKTLLRKMNKTVTKYMHRCIFSYLCYPVCQ